MSISLPKKLVRTRQVYRRKSRSLPEVRRRITEGSSDDRRKFAGNSPEEAIDAPEQAAEIVLEFIVVSTMIKLEMGGDPINLILGQLGPWKTQIGPNGSTHSNPDFLASGGTAWVTGGTAQGLVSELG